MSNLVLYTGAKVFCHLHLSPQKNIKSFANPQRSIVQKENLGHTKNDQFNIPLISSEIRGKIAWLSINLINLHLFKFSQILFHCAVFFKSLLLSEIPLDIKKKSIFEDIVCSGDFFFLKKEIRRTYIFAKMEKFHFFQVLLST